ncbi:MAG: DUF1254 domain-containing protein [Burkholderiales bacterium]|nr:DUF1254 domain-containing protein [Burkholderiales bacterium]
MQASLTVDQARRAAYSAFIYGLPMVENYVLMYDKAVKEGSVGFNVLKSEARLYSPADRDVVTPNNDTAYSMAWMELRPEPLSLAVPSIPANRYWSFQFVDYFTNNFEYVGRRTFNDSIAAAEFLIVPPSWPNKAKIQDGREVIFAPSDIIFVIGRTQVLDDDLASVEAIQAQYTLTPLSAVSDYQPVTVPPDHFLPAPPPSNMAAALNTLEFFNYMNLAFTWAKVPQDQEIWMLEFARINVGPNQVFDANAFSAEIQQALGEGMANAYKEIVDKANTGDIVEGWKVLDMSMQYFGTSLQDTLFRAIVAYKGIYANTPIEAVYPIANYDAKGELLDGDHHYTIHFTKEQLPPAQFFWSLSMYGPDQLFVENEIGRYSISDRTDGIQFGEDESLTIYIQHDNPGPAKVNNWLPTPSNTAPRDADKTGDTTPGIPLGRFYVVLRIYGPSPETLETGYQPPGLVLQAR